MDIELEKLKKLEEALSDCVDILRDCQVDKTCDNCKHSDLPRGYEPCVYCRNKDDWEPKESSCPCEDGIDSKFCVGCEHSEDGKRKYKPYVKVDEFIVELEEQNANLIAMLKAEREVRVNDEFLKGICERNAEIDKLKMGLKWDADNRDELLKENVELEKKLTTAKEIIKDLLFFLNKSYNKDWPMCMDVAEQFLKEVKE